MGVVVVVEVPLVQKRDLHIREQALALAVCQHHEPAKPQGKRQIRPLCGPWATFRRLQLILFVNRRFGAPGSLLVPRTCEAHGYQRGPHDLTSGQFGPHNLRSRTFGQCEPW